MMARFLRTRDLLLGIVLAAVVALAVPPLASGTGGGFGGSSFDRGDNPVVGSLPCIVDPALLDLFWVPFDRPQPDPFLLQASPPTLGLIGTPELAVELLDAYGSGFGYLDAEGGWRCLGLVDQATVVLDRWVVAGGTTDLWQFLPSGYLGGNLRIDTGSSVVNRPILAQDIPIALQTYASYPDAVGQVRLTFSPPAGSALTPRTVEVDLQGGLLLVRYRP